VGGVKLAIRTIHHYSVKPKITCIRLKATRAGFVFGGIDYGETDHLAVSLDVFAYLFIDLGAITGGKHDAGAHFLTGL
jgi:hypothetical protein